MLQKRDGGVVALREVEVTELAVVLLAVRVVALSAVMEILFSAWNRRQRSSPIPIQHFPCALVSICFGNYSLLRCSLFTCVIKAALSTNLEGSFARKMACSRPVHSSTNNFLIITEKFNIHLGNKGTPALLTLSWGDKGQPEDQTSRWTEQIGSAACSSLMHSKVLHGRCQITQGSSQL